MGTGPSSTNKTVEAQKAPTVPGLKVVLVGDCGVGKTSVFLRLLHNQFCPVYTPTHKVNIDNMVQKINQPSHALVSLTLWDIPGREEISLRDTYFRDMDALVVVADLTDEASLRMAVAWKQLALNAATTTDQSTATKMPVLLLGNKLDVIEDQMLADLKGSGKEEPGVPAETTPTSKLHRPPCVTLMEKLAAEAYFTGSAAVSAKSGDGSVGRAVQSFLRRVLETRSLERRWQVRVVKEAERRSRDTQGDKLHTTGIPQFDNLLDQGQVVLTRVMSLAAHFKATRRDFQQRCVAAGVVEGEGCSVESCLAGLKQRLAGQSITLKLVVRDGFCVLEAQAEQSREMEKGVRYALKAFNKEWSAVCQTCAAEAPVLALSLAKLDSALADLCAQPLPPDPDNGVDARQAGQWVEGDRARLRDGRQRALDLATDVETALKKARTAFVWA